VRRDFVRIDRDYFFTDGARAFTDRGTKLTTPSENTQLIRDLVSIAQERGWQRIAVSGTARFREQAWGVAREAGLEVSGYRASALDEQRLVRRLAQRGGSASAEARPGNVEEAPGKERSVREPSPANPARPREHAGQLLDHGIAPYQHRAHEATSYFVKLQTPRGELELWGVDLERAFRESLSKPAIGDEVVLRAVKREPVTVKKRERGEGDAEILKDLATHRNRWMIEKKEFLERRSEAAQVLRDPAIAAAAGSRSHPELLGAYLQVHAAQLAAARFRDPADRERFVSLVRTALADSVARGEALPAVRLRQGPVQQEKREQIERSQERDRSGRER